MLIFQQKYGSRLDYREFHCTSIFDLCIRLADIFFIQSKPNEPQIIFPARRGQSLLAESGETI